MNRGRTRRCDRGRTPRKPLIGSTGWEGAVIREIRESEDLPVFIG